MIFGNKFFQELENTVNNSVWPEDLAEDPENQEMIDQLMLGIIEAGRKTVVERLKSENSILDEWETEKEIRDQNYEQGIEYSPETVMVYDSFYNDDFYHGYYNYNPLSLLGTGLAAAAVFTILF